LAQMLLARLFTEYIFIVLRLLAVNITTIGISNSGIIVTGTFELLILGKLVE